VNTSHRRSSLPCSAERGFTLIEILVTTGIVSAVMMSVVTFLLSTARHRREAEVRLEVTQGLRAAADVLERDLRLAGACLPPLGNFVALDGKDQGKSDEITVRIGARHESACLRANLTTAIDADSTSTLEIDRPDGFEQGKHAYLVDLGGNGEFFYLQAVDAGAKRLTANIQLTRFYPVGSTVYVLEERRYAITSDLRGRPMMTVQLDDDPEPWPMALGIVSLDAKYTLRRGKCPASCDVVDIPADDTEWRLVTDVKIDLAASFPSALRPGAAYGMAETMRAKPRNLLP
jgi:prepilin-type N-terminal cleavage/methylation domain-containing protein